MSPLRAATDIDKLVAQYPPPAQALIGAARRTIRAAFPRVTETADPAARLIGYRYGPGYQGVVATLILSKAGAKIGIPYGVGLPDPAGLLRGAGKVHRHVAVASGADLSNPALRQLLAAALRAWQQRSDGALPKH